MSVTVDESGLVVHIEWGDHPKPYIKERDDD